MDLLLPRYFFQFEWVFVTNTDCCRQIHLWNTFSTNPESELGLIHSKGPLLLPLLPKKRVLFSFSPKPRSFMWITPIQSNKQWTFRQSLDENKTAKITAHFRVIYGDILARFICKNNVNKSFNFEIFRPEVWYHTLRSFWHLPNICDPI